MSKIYRIDKKDLHMKKLTEAEFEVPFIRGADCTQVFSDCFYHYTSPEGLMGILKTRTLYFTDCQFLNDYKERLGINYDLEMYWALNGNKYDKRFVKLLNNIRVCDYEDKEYANMERDMPYGMGDVATRYFICSASKNKDSLSMWKYYAKNNTYNGYCIGLATYALVDEWIDRDTSVAVEEGEIIYNDEDKQNIIHDTVEELYDKWCKYEMSLLFDRKITSDFQSWVSIMSLFFKSDRFASEEEYRFVAIVPVDKLNEIYYENNGCKYKMYDFRVVDGVLVPYIKMPFNYWHEEDCWAIDSIGISPSLDFKQKKVGLEHFIKSLDYKMKNCEIYVSDITLRY